MNSTEPNPSHPPEPPESPEEVIASVLGDLGRRWMIARKAAERAMRQEGATGDALRSASKHIRGMVDSVRESLPSVAPDPTARADESKPQDGPSAGV